MTTTIHFSGLNTRPGFSFRPAPHSGCPVCTWISLPSWWLTFTRVGLSLSAITHWITITNFIPIYVGFPKVSGLPRREKRFVRDFGALFDWLPFVISKLWKQELAFEVIYSICLKYGLDPISILRFLEARF